MNINCLVHILSFKNRDRIHILRPRILAAVAEVKGMQNMIRNFLLNICLQYKLRVPWSSTTARSLQCAQRQ